MDDSCGTTEARASISCIADQSPILTNGPVCSAPVTHALSEGAGHCSRHQPKRGGEEHFLGYPVPLVVVFFL